MAAEIGLHRVLAATRRVSERCAAASRSAMSSGDTARTLLGRYRAPAACPSGGGGGVGERRVVRGAAVAAAPPPPLLSPSFFADCTTQGALARACSEECSTEGSCLGQFFTRPPLHTLGIGGGAADTRGSATDAAGTTGPAAGESPGEGGPSCTTAGGPTPWPRAPSDGAEAPAPLSSRSIAGAEPPAVVSGAPGAPLSSSLSNSIKTSPPLTTYPPLTIRSRKSAHASLECFVGYLGAR